MDMFDHILSSSVNMGFLNKNKTNIILVIVSVMIGFILGIAGDKGIDEVAHEAVLEALSKSNETISDLEKRLDEATK